MNGVFPFAMTISVRAPCSKYNCAKWALPSFNDAANGVSLFWPALRFGSAPYLRSIFAPSRNTTSVAVYKGVRPA
jgi:hypothetical protein